MRHWFLRNKTTLFFFAKAIITAFSLYYLIIKVSEIEYKTLKFTRSSSPIWALALFLLMPVNWGLEAIKWKWSLKKIYKISFLRAFREVWIGVAIGFFTPARIGEILGRTFSHSNKTQALSVAIANSLAQSSITLLVGILSFFYFSFWENNIIQQIELPKFILLFFAALCLAIVVPFEKKIFRYLQKLIRQLVGPLLMLSLLRYLVFILQFYFAFQIQQQTLCFLDLGMAVGLYYILNTLLPVFAIAEAGSRAFVASLVFPLIGIGAPPALFAALFVYFVNLIPPVLIGNILLLFRKTASK